ncbi:MAG: polyamine aminopropyltransferase [Sutterellaceae bacterium]|nr:polyamine aminopropyltransferase [Burkholderiaceae bacterium]MCX7901229.1 polyamine aminopropyltransferase [Burkholderiaceae bacterium]MDW8429193.1 polyamine aminopropyltransferase [Sutterellaceae bacterium]
MQGLHLTGDLFDCGCSQAFLTDLTTLSKLCREATLEAGLTVVDEKYHVFPEYNGQPGGITGAVLLAESHLAVHTWPERRGVTLDVYVCNFTADNSGKAQQLFDALLVAFRPRRQVVNRIVRGDLNAAPAGAAAPQETQQDELIFDWLNAHAGYGYTAKACLETIQSPYQRVEVYDTHQFGRLFRLDGRLMTSEGEEFFYHECMTHPALLAHPNPQSVLVVGGGDGGSTEEIFKHPSVRRVVMAELDAAVIDVARRYLQQIHRGALDDPRLQIKIGDGYDYVKHCDEKFDLVVLDLTDPDTPAFHLYSEEFFRMCQRVLNPGGLMTMHLGSPVYQPATVQKNARNLRRVFQHVAPMALFIPLYGSLWCLGVASDSVDPRTLPVDIIAQRLRDRRIGALQYYNPEVHQALFALPNFVRQLTSEDEHASVRMAA